MPRIVKDEGKYEFSNTDDGNVNWYNHLGQPVAVSTKIVDLHIPYDRPPPQEFYFQEFALEKVWHVSTGTDVQHWSLQYLLK